MLIRKWFGLSVGLVWWSALCACKASILTGRARRGLFETSHNLVAEHLLSVSAPVATYLVVLGARSTACFCRVFSELRMPIFCHHTPPSCCHLHSERSSNYPLRPSAASEHPRCAPTHHSHRCLSGALTRERRPSTSAHARLREAVMLERAAAAARRFSTC